MNWYRVKYALPIHEDGKPEIVVFKAETEAEIKRRLVDYYEKKCRNVYGTPEIVSVEAYDSWNAAKQSVNAGGD